MNDPVLEGTVQSGAAGFTPLAGVPVTLYRATADVPVTIGHATTDENGAFAIPVPDLEADTIYYATAVYRPAVVLVAVVGRRIAGRTTLNEMSTVAAAYSMAQFSDGTRIAGDAFGLRIAAGMNDNLVAPGIGIQSPVLLTPPNANQTTALQTISSLANLVFQCLRRGGAFQEELFNLATPPGGPRPTNTFQAMQNIAHYPAHNVDELFAQSLAAIQYFGPALQSPPDAWTLAVKFHDTGDEQTPFGGPANIAFDRHGYAWIANNVIQGTPDSGNFIVVLQPDGRPAWGAGGRPRSPVTGGGIKGPGWGVTIDPRDHVWVGNFGWGVDAENPRHGSVSEFQLDGTALSPVHGWQPYTHRVQATVSDRRGNIWQASYENGRVVVYVGGDSTNALWGDSGSYPFGVAIDGNDTAWVTNGGGLGWPVAHDGTVARFRLENDDTTLVALPVVQGVGKATKVIAIDANNHAWVAASGDSKVYHIAPEGRVIGIYEGGGIDGPWGLAVDGDQNIWVANFGRMGVTSVFSGALSRLKGSDREARPAGVDPGTPLSPPTGYTLKSGGAAVTLPGGDVLYSDGQPCYTPFMRATSCQIDQAGNVWVVNNWKPGFGSDFDPQNGDPGGDGIVIFVGLAKPPALPEWLDLAG